jgi:uncharacterized PurR-regulated membrane protein YhhQ (DUF165 family)
MTKAVTFLAFVATVWVANYAVQHYGVVGVGFGLKAPAGVYVVGVAFTLRDALRRSWLGAVTLSNTVGLALDSYLFLTWSGLGLAFFWGQVVGKAWMTLAAVVLIALVRAVRRPLPA